MAKFVSDLTMDAQLDYIGACDIISVCSAQPTTWAEGYTTYMLSRTSLAPGDFAKAQGDAGAGSRKTTIAAKSNVGITNSGSATHVALMCGTGSTVRVITTCTTQYLNASGSVNVPTFKFEIGVVS